jgi:hypothetical protein
MLAGVCATRVHVHSLFVGDPAVTLTATLTVTWPALSCLLVVGELRSRAPVRTRAGTGRGEDMTGLAGWSAAPPTEGLMLLPTHDRDLIPGSGKGFDNQANMCCHSKPGMRSE